MTINEPIYAVYFDEDKEPVLLTYSLDRARAAMDAVFDLPPDYENIASWDKPKKVLIKRDGEAFEMRRYAKAMRLGKEKPAEVHHHAAPYVSRLEDFKITRERNNPMPSRKIRAKV